MNPGIFNWNLNKLVLGIKAKNSGLAGMVSYFGVLEYWSFGVLEKTKTVDST